jgi:polar amino acid transport system substrate-binding protein
MDYKIGMPGLVRIAAMTFLTLLTVTSFAAGLRAEGTADGSAPTGRKLIVAIRDAPPFSFKGEAGKWTGITVDAWEKVAATVGYEYEYREYELAAALEAIRVGEADIGVGAFSITAKRAEVMYFTHSYASAGLGIATTRGSGRVWGTFFDRLLTWDFFRMVLILGAVLVIVGALVWAFERKANRSQFSSRPVDGLASGFWWSAVTMTTVGYGDKSPVTLGGRIVGLAWMFTSIIIIAGLTGSIAAALTLVQIAPKIRGPEDLRGAAVGTVQASTADEYLVAKGVHPVYFQSVQAGLSAVDTGDISAFVADHPILTYWVASHFAGRVDVLPQSFHQSYLALPMPTGSALHRNVDLALLQFVETPAWSAILTKYSVIQ